MNRNQVQHNGVRYTILAVAVLTGLLLFGSQVGARILVGGKQVSANKTQAIAPPPLVPNATNTPTATPTCGPAAWTTQASYPISIGSNAVTALNGLVYSFGGVSGTTVVANAY